MLGAIIGDIVASPYEFDQGDKTTVFPFFHPDSDFTDDTVMTIAVARALMDADGDAAGAPAFLFGYDLSRAVDEIRRSGYDHVESCHETVPEALTCFFESHDFESALRLGVSIGGDTDTVCAIIGGIAEAAYGIPADMRAGGLAYLPPDILAVLEEFWEHALQ